jgi:hypothetical protein
LALYESSPDGSTGVNALQFRVSRGKEQKPLIRRLEDEELIRSEGDNYFISLVSIRAIGTTSTRHLLLDAEQVYTYLRAAFQEGPLRAVPVSMLAADTRLGEETTRRTLSYMFESSTIWLRSWANNVMTAPDASLLMGEGIQDYETFDAVVDQMNDWRINRVRARSTGNWPGMPDFSVISGTQAGGASPAIAPAWVKKLPPTMAQVMTEVYAAAGAGLRTLAAIGVRTALDLYFSDVLGSDVGTFADKIKKLQASNFLSSNDASYLPIVIDGGNASAHRGYMPSEDDLETILAIGERFLRGHYDLPSAAKQLQSNVPPRVKTTKSPGTL